ncbi:MAG: UDP-N-acetylmuramoyl-L-alanine--D-glutamate ligase [Calditrichales bacterium]|nr:UDP-N-acetylmuramoyl-L-alanine--D-glutamate ligase [Calditrichales bacterium]
MAIDIKNKKITVLGAARSGLAAAKLVKNFGAQVFVSDISKKDEKKKQIEILEQAGIEYEFGAHSKRAFEADLVALSPGIPVKSEIVQFFMQAKIPVYSEIEIAGWFCRAPIIAVTGSNGKTTTTTLIGEMLKKRYPDAIVAGNIGAPFSDYVENSHEKTWAVVEVSSFQLETIDTFCPCTAAVLNFAPNHLDHYKSYEDYLKAKWRIIKNLKADDLLIYNSADQKLSGWAEKLSCRLQRFDIEGGKNAAAFYEKGALFLNGKKLIDVNEMPLRGIHNYMNAMAAALAAVCANVSFDHIKETLQTFNGVEHRLEFVAEKNGVKYINDSKATTVESLSFALQSFNEPIVLIAGGKDKGSDFTKLNDLISKHVKEIILIGNAAFKISEVWRGLKPLHIMDTLESAVSKAQAVTEKGDVVILSPACASFDMFADFEDRGRQFKKIVNNL